jgi:hypothetical protein
MYRQPEEPFVDPGMLAGFNAVAVATEISKAVDLLLDARPNDLEFQQRIQRSFAMARKALASIDGAQDVIVALHAPAPASA